MQASSQLLFWDLASRLSFLTSSAVTKVAKHGYDHSVYISTPSPNTSSTNPYIMHVDMYIQTAVQQYSICSAKGPFYSDSEHLLISYILSLEHHFTIQSRVIHSVWGTIHIGTSVIDNIYLDRTNTLLSIKLNC